MPPHSPTIDAHATGILTRAIQPENDDFSPTAAHALLCFRLDPADRQRLHELLVKNQGDALTAEERGAMDSYLHVELLLDLLQAKARATLQRGTRRHPGRSNG
jgi:hypothetical protein